METDLNVQYELFTMNRDHGESSPYPGLEHGGIRQIQGVSVHYLPSIFRHLLVTSRILKKLKPDYYYFNSLHAVSYTWLPIIAIRCRLFPKASILIAPRGECSAAALLVSGRKKRIAKQLLRLLLPKSTIWHASSPREQLEIEAWARSIGRHVGHVVVASDPGPQPDASMIKLGTSFPLELVFLSRIHPIKGLIEAIEGMQAAPETVHLSIYGVIDDPDYWDRCLHKIAELDLGHRISYEGKYQPNEASDIFRRADALLLPTQSENFGRVIAEAMSVGCPVLIPDTTMWTEMIESGNGAIISDAASISSSVSRLSELSTEERNVARMKVLETYSAWFENPKTEFSPFRALKD